MDSNMKNTNFPSCAVTHAAGTLWPHIKYFCSLAFALLFLTSVAIISRGVWAISCWIF